MFRQFTQSHQQQAVWGEDTHQCGTVLPLRWLAGGVRLAGDSHVRGSGIRPECHARGGHGNGARLLRRIGGAAWSHGGEYSGDQMAPVAGMPGMPEPGGPYGEFFQRFFQDRMPQRLSRSAPRGVAQASSSTLDGLFLTNNHVVDGAQEVTVTLADKQVYKARVDWDVMPRRIWRC